MRFQDLYCDRNHTTKRSCYIVKIKGINNQETKVSRAIHLIVLTKMTPLTVTRLIEPGYFKREVATIIRINICDFNLGNYILTV